MKKYLVFMVSFGMFFFLAACGVPQVDYGGNEGEAAEEKGKNLTSTFGEQLSWIPNGYTGAIAIITEANSGDMIVQTGDQLLYRNEIYGFQVLLGRGWKGVEIATAYGITYFVMPVSGREESDKNFVLAPGMSHFSKTVIPLYAYTYQEYSSLADSVRREDQPGMTIDDFLKNTIAKNNHHIFVDFAWKRKWYMEHNESNFEREKYLDLFYNNFQVFDIEKTH